MYSSFSQINDLPQCNGFVEVGDKELAPSWNSGYLVMINLEWLKSAKVSL